jgi:FkbM family methyltransferase
MGIAKLLAQAMAHPLGARARLRTLIRIADWQIRSRLASVVATDWINGSLLLAARHEHGATGNIYFGLREPYDLGFLAHLLGPGDVFVDGGANIGAYTVLAMTAGAKVHAFEPAAETLERLRQNVKANSGEAHIHPLALGERSGQARFTRGQDAENRLSESGEALVQLATLDSFGLAPTAIKLDLEGGEEAALAGAAITLAAQPLLAILVETVTPAARTVLAEAGFIRRWYDPFTRELCSKPIGKPANQLWVRDEPAIASRLRGAPPLRLRGRDLFA